MKEYFLGSGSMHISPHGLRVSFYSWTLCHGDPSITKDEKDLLDMAAKYHDIGLDRTLPHEEYGLKSWEKLVNLDCVNFLETQQKELLRYLIENHHFADREAVANVSRYNLLDKKKALHLLNIFKDADALDRMRFGDLDVSLLRTKKGQALGKKYLKLLFPDR